MSKLILLWKYAKKNFTKMIVLSVVYLMTLLMLCLMRGYYNYESREVELLQNSYLKDADYFMMYFEDFMFTDTKELICQIQETNGVKSVIYGHSDELSGLKFNSSGDFVYPEDIIDYDSFDPSGLSVSPDDQVDTAFIYPNFYILYENPTDNSRTEVRDMFKDRGEFVSVDSIIENKDTEILRKIRSELAIPWIVFGIIMYASIVMTMMIQHDHAYDFAVYSICGARMSEILFIGIGNMAIYMLPPCALVCLYIKQFDIIMAALGINYENWSMQLTDKEMYICIILSLLLVLVSMLTQILTLCRRSPIQRYREDVL